MQDRYLIDKSALARWTKPSVKEVLKPLHERDLLAVCRPTEYEMIHSARDSSEATRISTWLHAFDYLPCDDDSFTRALAIQRHALNSGFHRALSLPGLLIAATAERHRRTVLPYDGRAAWQRRPLTADR
ncbi:PIN domain nuclease [Streptomyces zingiberis]|uniref:Ribonuclease VapC n=1 Tax=Streptomyces zingiberis TaxID=2053010 RepID=A0ABX1BMV4_9ACTN|nr:PIN domain nuclease [Streptomyces zingiberis]NJP99040.1 PIN domain nuclease [Streptomyces zingiberis]